MFERYTEKARRVVFFGVTKPASAARRKLTLSICSWVYCERIRPCIVGLRKQIPSRSAAASDLQGSVEYCTAKKSTLRKLRVR
jgi:hypothetical protein